MHVAARVRRRTSWLLTLVTAAAAVAAAPTGAGAAPPMAGPPSRASSAPNDPEGGTPALREQLEAASKGFLEARTALERSQARQKALAKQLTDLQAELAVRGESLGQIAGAAYRTGRLGPMSTLLNANSPDGFLDRAAVLGTVAANEDRRLRDLLQTKETVTRARLAVDNEVREQQKQLILMGKRKDQAERALKAASAGGGPATGPTSSGSSPAAAARRNSDGSLPSESCSRNDPTTSGCISPRTLNALNQAKAAGFTRFVSCFRSGGSGEHPKGRACDFAAQRNGFGGTATGGDRTYGNNLAAYFVRNANRLGVLYVIWFRQIWLPSSGWRAYNGAGDPSSEHTNHVHLSVV